MRRSHLTFHALVLLGLFLDFRPACADTSVPAVRTVGVAVEDFSYLDTSGEPADQTAAHQQRLRAFMTALRRDVDADGRYRLVPPSCTPPCTEQGPAPAQQSQSVAQGDARIRIIGGIQKMSTLVQWAKVAVVEIDTDRVLFERRYSFRGDNDEAWDRAEAFVFRDIREVLAADPPASAAAEPRPIELAVFDFELEDTTAAAPATGVAASDAGYLVDVTNGVRELLQQSGRYRVIDVSGTTADAAKKHALRDCGGCDAAIAQKLGADQSLIGVVRRVSRTEYTIGFQIRDARTGAVVSQGDSGLRMGADYSWRRGAVYLIGNRLLGSQSQR